MIRSVEKFDEIVFISGSGITALRIDLAENDLAGGRHLALDFAPASDTGEYRWKNTKKDQSLLVVSGARY